MQKISPFLWFDDQAEQAANFYVSVFENSRITRVTRYPEGSRGKAGSVMTVNFDLDGREFVALNGGPLFSFNNAVSFVVNCDSQEEVDLYWEKLLAGGKPQQCGWLCDKYGVVWQIVPRRLIDMMQDKDAARARRVTEAMMKMIKLDLSALERAYAGR